MQVQRLLDSYRTFLRLALSLPADDPLYLAGAATCERVLQSLPRGGLDTLEQRLDLLLAIQTEDLPGEDGERLEHPAWLLHTLCADVRKYFGLSEGDMPDVDEALLKEYLQGAFPNCLVGAFRPPMDLEAIISILPQEYVMPNTRLSDELSSAPTPPGELEMVVSGKSKREKTVLTKAILTFGDDKAIIQSGRQNYTPYDSAVYSGIITLFEAENNIITPAMVYRAMNGLMESEYINPTTLQKVIKSIEKNRRSLLSIDFTQEAIHYMRAYEEPGSDFKTTYEGNLLVADKVTVRSNGTEQIAYKILRKPILYEYAQTVGQVITVPILLLQTKGGVRSTEDVIVLREFLLRRIENFRRRHGGGMLNIPYQDIYKVCGVSSQTHKNLKDKYKKLRIHTEALLTEWQELKYIEAYRSLQEKGRTITALEIAL